MSEPEASYGTGRTASLHDDLMTEYYRLADIVEALDQRLLTVKGWGVTLSLAALGLGFQQGHYGLFLVAAASGLAFWLVEGSIKLHQMRYYPRMGDIEVLAHELYGQQTSRGRVSAPLIDWSWRTATSRLRGGEPAADPWRPSMWAPADAHRGARILLYPHVALPHAIAAVLGGTLFVLGLLGRLGPI